MAEPAAAAACLTCTKVLISTELAQAVTIGSREEVQGALAKHFWFSESESFYSVLCSLCWSKIHDFHQFYTEVEGLHAQQLQPDQLLEVKQEPSTIFVEENVSVKCESEKEEEEEEDSKSNDAADDHVEQQEDSAPDAEADSEEEDSDYSEEEPPVKKIRKSSRTKKPQLKKMGRRGRPVEGWQKDIKDESFIAETVNLQCDTCSDKFDTFEDLQKHSMSLHDKLAYVFCCSLKFSRKPRLVDHIQYHLNPAQFACTICSNKQFGDREALKRHMRSIHVEEEEKTMQCSVCPKRFAQKRFLNLHEKYHRNLQEKKFHCEPCNRYFAYASLLRHHNEEVHENTPDKYVCHICAKSYNIYTSYKSHVDSHDEEAKKIKQLSMERVQCSECNAW